MPLDLSALSLPLPGDAPSGENLEYDAAYAELEIASQPVEERVIGDSVLAAQDPDWDEVARLASGLLARTRDLRIAVTLANAALRLDGLPGFAAVLGYMAESLETHWDSVHPQLDPDDDDDPTMRVNAVLGLADPATTLRALRLAPLTDSRGFGRFHLRDMLVADGEATAPDGAAALDPQTIFAAFQDTPPERLAEITAAADAILAHARAISAAFDARIGAMGPDLDPLIRMARDIRRRLPEPAGAPEAGTEAAPDAAGDHAPAGPAPAASGAPAWTPPPAAPGTINSPQDVIAALDRIADYYARKEPSSPLPLLIGRARRLVSADFLTVIRDLAPMGLENVGLVGGLPQHELHEPSYD